MTTQKIIQVLVILLFIPYPLFSETAEKYHSVPPFISSGSPPLVMLTMSKDHRLYHAAYNDASDIDGDGKIDIRYNPTIDYYGYFDSYKYYQYNSSKKRFEPKGVTDNKKKPSGEYWSGDFLNYITMTRMDCIRKVLYGGYRVVDTKTETVLRRAYVPEDAHTFGKEYTSVQVDSYKISDYTPYSEPKNNQRIFFASTTLEQDGPPVLRVALNRPSNQRIWGWVAKASPVAKNIVTNESKQNITISSNDLKDFTVDVLVCDPQFPETNAKQYPNGNYKPVGMLQRYGESNQMEFGLLTGSYEKNMAGGVLRKNIGPINDEIDPSTGQFEWKKTSSFKQGIIYTIDQFKIVDYSYAHTVYKAGATSPGWPNSFLAHQSMVDSDKKFPDWGNPLAEMIYETARYFAGKASPTSAFTYTSSKDFGLELPKPTWKNPYDDENFCAQPIMVAISDIFPSYDSDHLPGSAWEKSVGNTLSGLNVKNELKTISEKEGISGNTFIGQSNSDYDNSCTPKNISGLHNIRGLCQEEPTKQGSYYSAAVTYFAHENDLNTAEDDQKMLSYMVALSSPLPEIIVPVGGREIKIIPFGKTVKTHQPVAINNPNTAPFLPTCTIAGFFVDYIAEDQKSGKFRVNFEDVEQGADYDMDVIITYEYKVVGSQVEVTLTNAHVAAGYVLHLGYIVSGSSKDGVYLELACSDAGFQDVLYKFDTPPGVGPGRPTGNIVELPRDQATRTFTPSATPAAQLLENPLWYAAKWGGFEDINGNGIPDLQEEWDRDANGVPDTYFYVANPTKLEEQLNKAFIDILSRTASGTSVSNMPQTREGEGAIYQSIFFPELKDTAGNKVNWAGQIHALFIDAQGNIREDTNQNSKLDLTEDRIVVFKDGKIFRYNTNGTEEISTDLQEVKYLWSSSTWLNDNNLSESQRSPYNSVSNSRYILTFADNNQNMICDSNELQPFTWPGGNPNLSDPEKFYSYLTLFPSFEDTPTAISNLQSNNPSAFSTLATKLAERQISFIRGKDQSTTSISGITIPETRTRQYSKNGVTGTWRLGDIVYSSPTLVAKPSENYHLLYKDNTYEEFARKYINRRQVIYAGANDGMLHAFNAGFYNKTTKSFDLSLSGETSFPLGMELWAYVPYNLLPHLLWLSDTNYSEDLHVPYMDLKPRVFDARIFFQADGVTSIDEDTYPYGWGTVIVAGMRQGGGRIRADLDKNSVFDPSVDRYMNSAYVVMDITNPELPPKLLGEIAMPRQGFTTCYPSVIPMSTPGTLEGDKNNWYLVFGSGPANALGQPVRGGEGSQETSDQQGHLYVVDLKDLVFKSLVSTASTKKIRTLGIDKKFSESGDPFALTEPSSFISDIITVDFDLDFKADVVYYGTTTGDQSYNSGTLRRLVTYNEMPTASGVNWTGNSTLISLNQPITAAPSVAHDADKRIWVYFGTGRYFNRGDVQQRTNMAFYGIKEPIDASSAFTWGKVVKADLYDSTDVNISNGTCLNEFNKDCVAVEKSGSALSDGWDGLLETVKQKSGWYVDLPGQTERVFNQAAIRGGSVIFTSYEPSFNLCEFEGNSHLWALYYLTGTAYYKPILRGSADTFLVSKPLGKGLASTPSIHVGEDGQTKVITQTSDGSIVTEEIDPPHLQRTGLVFWRENLGE